MKDFYPLIKSLALFALILSVSGCSKNNEKDRYIKVTLSYPIYETKSNVLAGIGSSSPRELEAPGKIFMYGKYIFVNEIDKGVHIFDNSDIRHPKSVAFIKIPGNLDIAVKGNTLYADMYGDLVAVDISEPLNAKLVKDIAHVFPERGYYYDSALLVIGWVTKDTLIKENTVYDCFGCGFTSEFAIPANMSAGGAKSVPGIAGSMARFAVVNNYLYTVNSSMLGVFDINNAANPVKTGEHGIGWNIETIYPFRDKLFVGSSTGMFVFDISQPGQPQQQGSFDHARACDPVVADENYAFVTLRTGNNCGGTSNQLDIVNVKDVMNPFLSRTIALTNPHGLAKDGDFLFVCDGDDGLKVFDAKDPLKLQQVKQLKGMKAYDVIAWNNRLLLVADEGLYQYDYSGGQLQQLSLIRSKNKITKWWLK